jgi:hypothetical protein
MLLYLKFQGDGCPEGNTAFDVAPDCTIEVGGFLKDSSIPCSSH